MPPAAPELLADDLAPGDAASTRFDWSGLSLARVRDPKDPLFRAVYDRLAREFAPRGEMEREEVIRGRLAWRPGAAHQGHAFLYEMLAVMRGGELVAMRDHTAIVALESRHAVVHLSHVLVEPPLRGTGLAGWLRALPLQTLRECAAAAIGGAADRMTLVAEMEPAQGDTPAVMARLRSYDRAGFLTLDREAVPYCQPDFRAPSAIDADAVRPLPLLLLVRRVGRENERELGGSEAREIVAALYTMFGAHVRADHMEPLWARLERISIAHPVALREPLRA